MFTKLLLLALLSSVALCQNPGFGAEAQVEQETVLVPVVVSEEFY
jgi:hypothetical protein